MLLLALETATDAAGVALLRADEVLAARRLPEDRPASEALLPAILALLNEQRLEPASIDAFAVSVGPGSFTGLRVGVATAKGLAFGARGRIAAVPTLAALAATQGRGCVAAVLDARRGEVYAAGYRVAALPLAPPLWGPRVLEPAALAARLETGWLVVGDGVPAVAPAVRARFGTAVELLGALPDAAAVGRLGAQLLAAGRGVAPAELAPLYVRRAEAEVRRTGAATDFDTPRRLS